MPGSQYTRGSEWKVWDLHFHTQSSPDYKNKSITDQNIIDGLVAQGVSVVAITDHNIIDKSRVQNLQALGTGKLIVLPAIEVRTDCGTGENIHVIGIFDEKADIDAINNSFSVKGELYKQRQEGKKDNELYVKIDLTTEIIRDHNGIITIHAGKKENGIEEITNALPVSRVIKKDIGEKIDVFEMGKLEDFEEYRTKVFPSIGQKPMIICSDNHNIQDYQIKARLWIKADTTLEGLRQAICSYDSRVKVLPAGAVPEEALYYIDTIQTNVADNIEITLKDNKKDKFCFSPWNHTLNLNRGLNCIVGDRGSGKSVFLDLLAHGLGVSKIAEITSKNTDHIINKLKKVGLGSTITFDITANSKDVEYYTQNEIESIARNYEITDIVSRRIHSADVVRLEEHIKNMIACYDFSTIRANTINEKRRELKLAEDGLKNIDAILKEITDGEYINFNKEISNKTKQLETLKKEREKHYHFVLELLSAVHKTNEHKEEDYETKPPISLYGVAYNEAFEELRTLLNKQIVSVGEHFAPKTIEESDENIRILEGEIEQIKTALKEYLKSKGFEDEENLSDKLALEQNKVGFQNDIDTFTKDISLLEQELVRSNTQLNDLPEILKSYEAALNGAFGTLSSRMSAIGKNESGLITFALGFNHVKAGQDFLSWLDRTLLEKDISKRSIRSELDKKLLAGDKLISPQNSQTHEEYKAKLDLSGQSGEYLGEYLSLYWDEFQNRYNATFNNLVEYKVINILYDGKNIVDCSFGQRATATIIILLSLGNAPIIIDEPESNLGEAVIYKELVDILKKIKTKRQIIFATHNANIVVNGDADLIIHLGKNPSVDCFTIENLSHREKLYALEGGKDAFEDRDKRYKKNRAA